MNEYNELRCCKLGAARLFKVTGKLEMAITLNEEKTNSM